MIKGHLKSLEKEQLQQFRLFLDIETPKMLSIESADLLNENKVKTYLEIVKEKINAPNLKVTASLFSKRYSYLIIVPALYLMSRYSKFLNVTFKNTVIYDNYENDLWMPKLFLKDQTILIPTSEIERLEWRSFYYKQIFSQHLNSVWDILSSVAKISKPTLWENTAVYTFWVYETILQELSVDKAEEDFRFLLFEVDGSFFGSEAKNPLARFYTNKIMENGHEIRPRKTCCLSYQISEKNMCKSCPKKC